MFLFRFEGCILDYCVFTATKLKGTAFLKCSLKETDFTDADLSGSGFAGSDLSGAIFAGSNLETVDFREALNIAIDPDSNRMKKAKFKSAQLEGLLYKYKLAID
jgi:fluoroquinolone resistance protein